MEGKQHRPQNPTARISREVRKMGGSKAAGRRLTDSMLEPSLGIQ